MTIPEIGSVTGNTASVTGGQIVVDETKQRDHLLVAGVVLPGDLAATRAVMRALVLGGQRRCTWRRKAIRHRQAFAAVICETGVRRPSTTPAAATAVNSMPAGHACTHLVSDAAAIGAAMLVLEQHSLLRWDNQLCPTQALRSCHVTKCRFPVSV